MKTNLKMRLFLRREKANVKGEFPIYVVCTLNGKEFKMATGEWLLEKDWDKRKNCPSRKFTNLNRKLNLQLISLEDFYFDKINRKENISVEMIKSFYKGEDLDGNDFYEYWTNYIKSNSVKMEENTLKNYTTTLNVLKLFKAKIEISEIDVPFVRKFDSFLRNERKMTDGGAWNRHKNLKTILKKAIEDGLLNSYPYDVIKIPRPKNKIEFLSEEEINIIANVGTLPKGAEIARDRFLMSCYTGLRYSDINTLEWRHIKNGVITKKMVKTKKYVAIPISPVVAVLLTKYQGENGDFVFPKISNNCLNKALRIVSKECGIKEFTFHVSRHTFGSLLGKGNLNSFKIMELMGHSDVRQSSIYVHSNIKDLSDALTTIPLLNPAS